MAQIPKHLQYTEEHEWIDLDDDRIATIGITEFAQSELGDIVFVELPEEGSDVTQMDSCGTIEAVKTVADVYAPVGGEIIEVNHQLEDSPTLINTDPYDDGWIVRIRLDDEAEPPKLLSAKEYAERIGEV